jgi:hypothetical protein
MMALWPRALKIAELFSGKIEVRRNVGDIVWIRKKITLFFPSASFEQK